MSNTRIETLMPLVGSRKLARRRQALWLAQLGRLIAWFRREVRIRRAINELAALDDRQLADIGMSRGASSLWLGTAERPHHKRSMKVLFLVGLFALLMSPLQAREPNEVAVTRRLSTSRTSSGQPIVLPRKIVPLK